MSDIYESWVASAASVAAALTDQPLKAAPGAGKHLEITQVVFTNEGTANSFLIEDEDGTAVYPPSGAIYLGANQTFNSGPLADPIPVAENVNVNVTTTADDHATAIVHGRTRG